MIEDSWDLFEVVLRVSYLQGKYRTLAEKYELILLLNDIDAYRQADDT